MDSRYASERVADLWSSATQYQIWVKIETAVAYAQADCGIVPSESASEIGSTLSQYDSSPFTESDVQRIQQIELTTKHDVVAFLDWARSQIGEHGRWLHFGLTSSDVVDTTMGLRFAELYPVLGYHLSGLLDEVKRLIAHHHGTNCLAYTHGEAAEVFSLTSRFEQWLGMLQRCSDRLTAATSAMRIVKVSGPVGNFRHSPRDVEQCVCSHFSSLHLVPAGTGNSQIVPRDNLAAWASAAASYVQVLGKVAIDFRLMSARGEAHEGWPPGRVGSSSMPHKRNPVTAEKLTGMGRLAAGYAAMLQPVDLWDERDISHSCVERVAVPDLWHVLFHSVSAAIGLLANAAWDRQVMLDNIGKTGRSTRSGEYANSLIRAGHGAAEAREMAMDWVRAQHEDV